TKYDKVQYAHFEYNSENKCMVLGDTFETKVAYYLKKNKLKPKVIKNYLVYDGQLLFNDKKLLQTGNVVSLECGLEVINTGKYSLFRDDGTDIMCNWNGYPLLVQCKFHSICDSYKKLSEYRVPIFGIFIISEGIKIYDEIIKMQYVNDMIVVNYSKELNNQINMLDKHFLAKTQKMYWCISLDSKKRIELELAYRYLEQKIDDK
ncbi:9963_t:CDS:2, partial [Cetraspora pellucida]